MITSVSVSSGKIKRYKKIEHSNHTWIDALNPTPEELNKISKEFGISRYRLDRSLDEQERSRVVNLEDGIYVAYQAPYFKKDEVITLSFAIFIKKNTILTLRNHKIVSLNQIASLPDTKLNELLSKGAWNFLHYILDEVNDNYFAVSEQITSKINELEDNTVDDERAESMESFFSIKKTLIYLHKSLSANRDVLARVDKEEIKELKPETRNKFRDIYVDTIQLMDMINTNREILTTIAEIHASNVSNDLNKVMKKLTVYAALVMVPTLISGIYGMNFRQMPELYWIYGYPFAIGLMLLSVIMLYILFKLKKWI